MKYHFELIIKDSNETADCLYKMSFKGGAKKYVTREQAENARQSMLAQTCRSGRTVEEELKRCAQTLDIVEIVPKKRESKTADPNYCNPFKAGDILCGSWGYSMVIPVFYEVIRTTKTQVILKELRSYVSEGDYMQGRTMPRLGEYCSSEYRCGVSKTSCCGYGATVNGHFVCLWDGTAKWHDRMD